MNTLRTTTFRAITRILALVVLASLFSAAPAQAGNLAAEGSGESHGCEGLACWFGMTGSVGDVALNDTQDLDEGSSLSAGAMTFGLLCLLGAAATRRREE